MERGWSKVKVSPAKRGGAKIVSIIGQREDGAGGDSRGSSEQSGGSNRSPSGGDNISGGGDGDV